jgi:adenosylcobinamide-GDP ribazoletransferase
VSAPERRPGPLDGVLVAHAFLTRLRVAPRGAIGPERVARSAAWFPLVGLTVGGAAALVRLAADPLGAGVATVAALATPPILTGALHEDGLADTADGLGPRGRERRLAAMRDSRLGTFGVLALALSVLARLEALLPLGARDAALALIAGHVLGRWAVLPVAAAVPRARADGLGATAIAAGPGRLALASILAAVLVGPALAAVGAAAAVGAVAAALVVAAGSGLLWWRAFGGITGDTLGATTQLVEIAVLVAVSAAA